MTKVQSSRQKGGQAPFKVQSYPRSKRNLPSITVASVGHIDHGKSSLVGRLLYDSGQVKPDRIAEWQKTGGDNFAFLLDSFEDEQKGEMTIDVFYSQFKTDKYRFTLVDDPGHLEFIKNMLTGVSQASGVILVISAKPGEGIQFQTKRHMMLVKLLGIEQVLVVINKMDLVNYSQKRFVEIRDEISLFLEEIGYDQSKIPFIPVSALKGDDVYLSSKKMSWYDGESLYRMMDRTFSAPKLPFDKPLRLSFQGGYTVEGENIFFVRVDSGVLRKNVMITLLPSGETTKVLKIKKANGDKEELFPGETAGLSLALKRLPERIEEQIGVAVKQPARLVRKVTGEIFLLLDELIEKQDRLIFRCGTREIPCTIEKILRRINSETGEILEKDSAIVNPAEMADVEIAFSQPTVVERFSEFPTLGRFLLFKGKRNIAAGITY